MKRQSTTLAEEVPMAMFLAEAAGAVVVCVAPYVVVALVLEMLDR